METVGFVYISVIIFSFLVFSSCECRRQISVRSECFRKVKCRYSHLLFPLDVNGGYVGLVITQALGPVNFLQWFVRQIAMFENEITSVERVLEYANCPQEAESQRPPGNERHTNLNTNLSHTNLSLFFFSYACFFFTLAVTI